MKNTKRLAGIILAGALALGGCQGESKINTQKEANDLLPSLMQMDAKTAEQYVQKNINKKEELQPDQFKDAFDLHVMSIPGMEVNALYFEGKFANIRVDVTKPIIYSKEGAKEILEKFQITSVTEGLKDNVDELHYFNGKLKGHDLEIIFTTKKEVGKELISTIAISQK